jgi:hypothetical protein
MKQNRFPLYIFTALLAVLLSACAVQKSGPAVAELPVDKGYADGKEIYFTHTETSNTEAAERMTAIMESPVFYVPSLATVPAESLANVFVFTNGVKGSSMAGFQPSVFDNPPGTEGYSPLRLMHMVTWSDETQARELKSAAEVQTAIKAGELTMKHHGTVINMPIIVWDGGKR